MNSTLVYVIALYIRLSAEDFKVGSLSIENQYRELRQYVDTMEGIKNIEIREFVDNGYSGTNFERPAVQELLDLVREGRINCIIVKDFTRFGRNSIEVGYFMERVFPLYGVRFISVSDNFDSSKLHGDTGGINVAFKYLVGEFYSRDLSIKVKSAKYVKCQRGEYQSKCCPYGYQKSSDGRLELDEEAASIVRLIFDMAHNGYGISKIAKELFQRGIPTPAEYKAVKGEIYSDRPHERRIWSTATIRGMLKDERYAGTYIAGKWESTEIGRKSSKRKEESQWIKIPNHHPPLISMDLFTQVQIQLFGKKRATPCARVYSLRHKVYCGCCHYAMLRTSEKSPWFRCWHSDVDDTAPCHGLKILECDLESAVYEILSNQARIILNLDDLASADALDIQRAKQSEYHSRIEDCIDKKQALYEQLSLKKITANEYKVRKAEIDRELEHLKQIHSAVTAQIEQVQMDEKTRQAQKELAREVVKSGKITDDLANTLIERVYVYPDNEIEIVWKMKDFCMEEH